MSDQKLRGLERRWQETGSPDDEAAYLLERVHVGELTQERLELAACCGHEGARKATGQLLRMSSTDRLGQILAHRGPAGVIEMATWIASSAGTELSGSDRAALISLIDGAREWVLCPCTEHGVKFKGRVPLGVKGFHELVHGIASLTYWCVQPQEPLATNEALMGTASWILSTGSRIRAVSQEALLSEASAALLEKHRGIPLHGPQQ